MLSLHSWLGNALAVILYTVLCLLPLCRFFYQVKKKRSRPWDFLLVALTGYSFYMLYQLINPALLVAYLILNQASRLSSLKPENGENRAFLLLGLEKIPLILSFCAMLLSKGFRDVNTLHEDNEMII